MVTLQDKHHDNKKFGKVSSLDFFDNVIIAHFAEDITKDLTTAALFRGWSLSRSTPKVPTSRQKVRREVTLRNWVEMPKLLPSKKGPKEGSSAESNHFGLL